jgi:hypothetical protein
MNKQARSRQFTAKQSARLGAYLAAGLGASTVATSTADAAIVNINIGPTGFNIGGINGGIAYADPSLAIDPFPMPGAGNLEINNDYYRKGLYGASGFGFAFWGGLASPRNFAFGSLIGGPYASFTAGWGYLELSFRVRAYNFYTSSYYFAFSPNFGPGSYMGFRTAQGNYGWLEVTWDSASLDFQILSGAYEDQVGVAIAAGAEVSPIPEPGTWVALAVFAGGAAFTRWRQRRNEAQQEAA